MRAEGIRGLSVVRASRRTDVTPELFANSGPQQTLFPSSRPGLAVFVYFPDVTETEFRNAVEFSRPGAVVELRAAPRFDIGTLDRRRAFEFFEKSNAAYVDLALSADAKFDQTAYQIMRLLMGSRISLVRPVMFLLAGEDGRQGMTAVIQQHLASAVPSIKEVLEVPHYTCR